MVGCGNLERDMGVAMSSLGGAVKGNAQNLIRHPGQIKNAVQWGYDPGNLFATPDAPADPTAPPPAPTVQNSEGDLDIVARQQAMALQRGRGATMMTGGGGLSNLGTSSKTLLGQ